MSRTTTILNIAVPLRQALERAGIRTETELEQWLCRMEGCRTREGLVLLKIDEDAEGRGLWQFVRPS